MRAYSVRKVRYHGMISYMPRFTGTLSYRIYPRYKYRAGPNTYYLVTPFWSEGQHYVSRDEQVACSLEVPSQYKRWWCS